jgi:manganese/zinc/iron transport system permease protein
MSAMVVAPGAAARQWTNKLGFMIGLAGFFGAFSGVSGALISSTGSGLSTGPVIVLVVSTIVVISLLFAPNRGLVWNWARSQKNRQKIHLERVLTTLFWMASQHDTPTHPHSIEALRVVGTRQHGVMKSLQELEERGMVHCPEKGNWALTQAGVESAEKILAERDHASGKADI